MKIIGIMTGNSIDACDIVLTKFSLNKMTDVAYFSKPISDSLRKDILKLKEKIKTGVLEPSFNLCRDSFFLNVHSCYIKWIATSVNEFLKKENLQPKDIDLIGFHGQTLDHNPPSVSSDKAYTLQMGSGQMLSNLLGIPVVYDFRSDDILMQGEGAPLMPPHNEHFAKNMGMKNAFFINAGNTSNLALILNSKVVLGYDCGPFNEFSDRLVQLYKNEPFDKDSLYGKKGVLIPELLRQLFYHSVQTKDGKNFLELLPPKSSDPSLYNMSDFINIQNEEMFYNTLHTVEYFSGYVVAYALTLLEHEFLPNDFVLFGGGWNNLISYNAFSSILLGKGYILKEHEKKFHLLCSKFHKAPCLKFVDGAQYMEARLVADMAYYYERKKAWTNPKLTGCRKKTILGIKATPKIDCDYNDLINRACKNWQDLKK